MWMNWRKGTTHPNLRNQIQNPKKFLSNCYKKAKTWAWVRFSLSYSTSLQIYALGDTIWWFLTCKVRFCTQLLVGQNLTNWYLSLPTCNFEEGEHFTNETGHQFKPQQNAGCNNLPLTCTFLVIDNPSSFNISVILFPNLQIMFGYKYPINIYIWKRINSSRFWEYTTS